MHPRKYWDDINKVSAPCWAVYDSDNEETRTIKRRLPKVCSTNNYVVELGLCGTTNFLGDSETSTNFSDMHGWISEMTQVIKDMRKMENEESRCSIVFIDDYCWLAFLC